MDDARLAASISRPGVRPFRWGEDEDRPEDVPQDVSFSTSAIGGHKECSLGLTRDPFADHSDLDRFDEFKLYLPGLGNFPVFEGYNIEFPKTKRGDTDRIGVSALGWSGYLSDVAKVVAIFADGDTSHWGEPSLERKAWKATADQPLNVDYEIDNSRGLTFTGVTDKSIPVNSSGEAVYASPVGVRPTKIMYRGTERNVGSVDGPILHAAAAPDLDPKDDYALTLDDTLRTRTITDPLRYVMLRVIRSVAGTPGVPTSRRFEDLVVYATSVPTIPTADDGPDGVLFSDCLPVILDLAAPLLTYTTGEGGSIRPVTFPIPQLAFFEPATVEEACAVGNAYHWYDYGVWDDREFFYHPPREGGRLWIARADDGAELDLEGEQAENAWTGVAVAYTNPQGESRIVAGPSYPFADATDATLEITDDSNPAVAHGRERIKPFVVGTKTTQSGAIEIGRRWLEEQEEIEDRGDLILKGRVRGDDGAYYPPAVVRGGDRVVIEDLDRNRERLIFESSFTGGNANREPQTTATLDSPSHRVEALLERLAISTPEA